MHLLRFVVHRMTTFISITTFLQCQWITCVVSYNEIFYINTLNFCPFIFLVRGANFSVLNIYVYCSCLVMFFVLIGRTSECSSAWTRRGHGTQNFGVWRIKFPSYTALHIWRQYSYKLQSWFDCLKRSDATFAVSQDQNFWNQLVCLWIFRILHKQLSGF